MGSSEVSPVIDRHVLWDAVVVGAGPAGCMTSFELARRGRRVLLLEAKNFPREKVCGGCLNRRAWSILRERSLATAVANAGAIELSTIHLLCNKTSVRWKMPAMHAISRSCLDAILAQAAVDQGVTFVTQTHGRIAPAQPGAEHIEIELKSRSGATSIAFAKVAIAADGLTHSSLNAVEPATSRIARESRVGLGCHVSYGGESYPIGELTMVVGRSGYVGVTRVELGQLNLAAALSVGSLRTGRRPGDTVAQMLDEAGLEVPSELDEANWIGTPPLTRESQRWSARRLFLVGDATGYVEPFTGEGMSWALAGATEVCEVAHRAIDNWSDDLAEQWHNVWRSRVREHQTACRALAWLLRRPRLAEWTLICARYAPWLTQSIMSRIAGSEYVGSETHRSATLGSET